MGGSTFKSPPPHSVGGPWGADAGHVKVSVGDKTEDRALNAWLRFLDFILEAVGSRGGFAGAEPCFGRVMPGERWASLGLAKPFKV